MTDVVVDAVFTARAFRAYVLDRTQWTEELWEAAQAAGGAVRRVKRNADGTMGEHFWTLTDLGLDLMNAGKVE